MAGRVNVDPDAIRTAANSAGDLARRLARVADRTRAAVSPGTSGWGDDEFGGKFADGDNGFGSGSGNTATSTESLATTFGNLEAGMRRGAKRLDGMEHGNTESF
ncbi:hypothetical protein [Nocardia jejuensis]|uniref:hypothetical protein n=1 Tax=Nocardia jejuensis TaxID=328049 RepID=UPI000830F66A|nr:hypothetical protein [Nocardia jejuensis]